MKTQLKVADKVVKIMSRFGNTWYDQDEVERLTKTRAILTSGIQVVNKEVNCWGGKTGFEEYGDRYNVWHIITPKLRAEIDMHNYKKGITHWFKNHNFTFEQMEQVYNLLNK